MNSDLNCFEALRPILDGRTARELDSLNKILDHFPGRTFAEIAKEIDSLKKRAGGGVDDLVIAMSSKVGSATANDLKSVGQALKKLTTAELKQVGKELQLHCSGSKTAIVNDLTKWFESGGHVKPMSPKEIAQAKVQELVEQARPLYEQSTPESANKLLGLLRSTKLTKDELEALAAGLGVTVSGTKKQMENQLESMINRRSVSHIQTHT